MNNRKLFVIATAILVLIAVCVLHSKKRWVRVVSVDWTCTDHWTCDMDRTPRSRPCPNNLVVNTRGPGTVAQCPNDIPDAYQSQPQSIRIDRLIQYTIRISDHGHPARITEGGWLEPPEHRLRSGQCWLATYQPIFDHYSQLLRQGPSSRCD